MLILLFPLLLSLLLLCRRPCCRCCCCFLLGQGRWLFADGLSFCEGSYSAGQRVQGKLVLFDVATKKAIETYDGR
jgi:hypothetical protein